MVAEVVVHVRREVVRLRLAQLADHRRVLVAMVEVERQRLLVVEELGVHRPLAELVPQARADERGTVVGHELIEGKERAAIGIDHEAETLERSGQGTVVSADGGGEPAFVDPASVLAQGEVVVRVQADPAARGAELPGHPGGRQAHDPAARIERAIGRRRRERDVLVCAVRIKRGHVDTLLRPRPGRPGNMEPVCTTCHVATRPPARMAHRSGAHGSC